MAIWGDMLHLIYVLVGNWFVIGENDKINAEKPTNIKPFLEVTDANLEMIYLSFELPMERDQCVVHTVMRKYSQRP